LRLAPAAHALTFAIPCEVTRVSNWRPNIREASLHSDVSIAWLERVMRVESDAQTMLAGGPIRIRPDDSSYSCLRSQLIDYVDGQIR
jgi:hypothetical protein